MTPEHYGAPWHAASCARLVDESLPELLAERIPLTGYSVTEARPGLRVIRLEVGGVSLECSVPVPDADGVFHLGTARRTVVPIASSSDLAVSPIACVGEQLLDHVSARLGTAPAGLQWSAELLAQWLPLERWVRGFLSSAPSSQVLDETNWLARQTHLRRLYAPRDPGRTHPSHPGRTCPLETPEGPNNGRLLSIALGARIEGGRLLPADASLADGLGLTASVVPLLGHTQAIRALMGVNLLRQWLPSDAPEPALVRTGREPEAAEVWCGRNLLTAYVSLGGDTFEDAIVVSESCAERFGQGAALEPGDKLANRHGQKGVVSRILPDREMPHMSDGTPVELVFSPVALHTRQNFGQVREAVLGRIARVSGVPVTAPPFEGPSDSVLRERLVAHGLPEDGMEQLTLGSGGPALARRSCVGWVYWGKTKQTARLALRHAVRGGEPAQRFGVLEYAALRDAGALANVADSFAVCSDDAPGADGLADRLGAGERPDPPGAPSHRFARLRERLASAGIQAELTDAGLRFGWRMPGEGALVLACPVAHPWLPERMIEALDAPPSPRADDDVRVANERLAGLLESGAPESLLEGARSALASSVAMLFERLVTREDVRPGARRLFSGRAPIVPGPELSHEQVGLPEELAWALLGSLAEARLGDPAALAARTGSARRALEEVASETWLLLHRAPAVEPASMLAFRPVVVPGRAIRLVPMACRLLNADHDGDLVAVSLPLTRAARDEAPLTLSLAARLRRQDLLEDLCPGYEAGWGLAELSRTDEGLAEIAELIGRPVGRSCGEVTRGDFARALAPILAREGAEAALIVLDRLWARGFGVSSRSGASLSPFAAEGLHTRPPSVPSGPEWEGYAERLYEELRTRRDYDDALLGPQLLLTGTGARGAPLHLVQLLGSAAPVGSGLPPRGLAEGLSADRFAFEAASGRYELLRVEETWEESLRQIQAQLGPSGTNVLARAWGARRPWPGAHGPRPGAVFAHAASSGETDPLTDLDARLFVGLPPLGD